MICPPSKQSSTRTESASVNGHHLCEDAVDGVGMDEGDLEAEEALARLRVDQLRTLGGEPAELCADVVDLVGDVVHARAARREELAHGGLVAERRSEEHTSELQSHSDLVCRL